MGASPTRIALALVALFGAALASAAATGPPVKNGFVLDPTEIAVEEILAGGPPRDGVPALDHPAYVAADAAPWPDDAMVIGVVSGGASRAYPIAILDWHELVNDSLGGRPILVSYCPLCGTGIVFDRRLGDAARTFGVSGLLYRSDLLLYDRETESLWSQISSQAVTGASRGQRLTLVRSRMQRWRTWRELHPDTTVLTRATGHRRNYGRSPYGDYATSSRLMFPVAVDRRYHPKTLTLGLRVPGVAARAYPSVELIRSGGRVEESFQGHRVQVSFDAVEKSFEVSAPQEVEVVEGFWFAWAAFHPETSVFVSPEPVNGDS